MELTGEFQQGFLAALAASPDAEHGIRAGLHHHLRWIARNRGGARVLHGERPDGGTLRALNRSFLSEVRRWYATHVHYGALRELPFELVAALWLGPAPEYSRAWLDGHARRSPTTAAEVLATAAWNALKEAP